MTDNTAEKNFHVVLNDPFRPSWLYFWNFATVALVMLSTSVMVQFSGVDYAAEMSILMMVAAFACGFAIWIKRLLSRYEIQEDKIVRQQGIIARKRTTIRISDLKSVQLEQSVPERILGIGDLAFYTAGSADAEIRFVGIDAPKEWCEEIDNLINEKQKELRGNSE